jgi:murein DD-endopeptidase MepM/ murein hydrolase activator NlpD
LHQGVDLAASPGSRVLAVGDGVIVAANPGLGKTVRKLLLDSPATWDAGAEPIAVVVYADLGRPLVEPGDRVLRGDPIALVDKAGFVHFAVKTRTARGETFIDPALAGYAYEAPTGKGAVS